MSSLLDAARAWLAEDPDPATRHQLQQIVDRGDEDALRESFGARLQFGTAGLRGVLGPGPNRMNRALVRRVSCGLGNYLLDHNPDAANRGVVVGFDGRRLSPEMAQDTAEVLAGLGIKVHLFDDVAPTPLVAFAVGHLGAAAGVVVTASHNPPEYNGYKVYWDNGAQIIPPHDTGISDAIEAIGSLHEVPLADLTDARGAGLVFDVSPAVTEAYLGAILALQRHPEVPRDLSVVYTAMHGVGRKLVEESITRAGLSNLHIVAEQADPDGEFPTVRFPNPEEDGAMDLSLALARQTNADLVLANDPDADRLAAAVRDGDGGYRMLSGDQIGTVLGMYLLTENLPDGLKPLLMTTIVSSRLLSRIAAEHGAAYDETLTGFKWIANASQRHREREGVEMILGYEEALGYSVGMVTPDKDGVSAALLFVEMTAVCKQRGQSVLDYLEAIYRQYGLYVSHQHSITLPGQEGAEQIAGIMDRVRASLPTRIGNGPAVLAATDYLTNESFAVAEGATAPPAPVDLPQSNVIALHLEGDSRILLRPSGTEPKIKYYFEIVEPVAAGEALDAVQGRAQQRLDALVKEFLGFVAGLAQA